MHIAKNSQSNTGNELLHYPHQQLNITEPFIKSTVSLKCKDEHEEAKRSKDVAYSTCVKYNHKFAYTVGSFNPVKPALAQKTSIF